MNPFDKARTLLRSHFPAGENSHLSAPKGGAQDGVIPDGQHTAESTAPADRYSLSPTDELAQMTASSRDSSIEYLFETVAAALRGNNPRAEVDLADMASKANPLSGVAREMQNYFPLLTYMAHSENAGEFYESMLTFRQRVFIEISSLLKKGPDSFGKLSNHAKEVSWGPGRYIQQLFDKAFEERKKEAGIRMIRTDLIARIKDIEQFEDVYLLRRVWNDLNAEHVDEMRRMAQLVSRVRPHIFTILLPLAIISEMSGTIVEMGIEDGRIHFRPGMDMTGIDSGLEKLIYAAVKHEPGQAKGARTISIRWDEEGYTFVIEDDRMSAKKAEEVLRLPLIRGLFEKVGWRIEIGAMKGGGMMLTIRPKRGDIVREDQFGGLPSPEGGSGNVSGYDPSSESAAPFGGGSVSTANVAGAFQFAPLAAGPNLMPAAPVWAAGGMAPAGIVPEIAARTLFRAL